MSEFQIEEGFTKLEEIVSKLEKEDITLEQSFHIYKEGMDLLKKCNQTLDKVEKQVLVLQEDGSTSEL